jgi:type VI secretion system secreted protein Hcp
MSVFHRSTDGFEQSEPNRREVLLAAGGLAAATALAANSGHAATSHVGDKKAPRPAHITLAIDDTGFTTFDVLAFSWGASNSGTTHQGGGGGAGAGKANVQDLSVTKYLDTNSPRLFKALVTGAHFRKATLTWVGPKGTPTSVLTLEEVLVTSQSSGGNADETRLTENVSLNFAKITFSFNDVKTAFDIPSNRAF